MPCLTLLPRTQAKRGGGSSRGRGKRSSSSSSSSSSREDGSSNHARRRSWSNADGKLSFAASGSGGSGSPRSTQQRGPQGSLKPLMDALDSCASCSKVLQVVLQADAAAGQQGVHIYVLSNALNTMKKKAACKDGSAADRRAVEQLLQLATQRLGSFGIRALTAFVRCAAAFPGLLQPQQLRAWQAALQQHKPVDIPAQNVSNMLLALGTLAQSDGQFSAVVSQPLAERLLQHAVALAAGGKLALLQDVSNTLYGAALLGLQPSAAQMQRLFSAVQQALEQPLRSDDHKAVTQILLACAQLCGLQSTPGAAPTPAEDPFLRCYPGAALVDALLERAVRSPLGKQAASQIVKACGRLLHMPSPEHWAALLAGGHVECLLC